MFECVRIAYILCKMVLQAEGKGDIHELALSL